MTNITILDGGYNRYTLNADNYVLGRMYDNNAEQIMVSIPEEEAESICSMIFAKCDGTIIAHTIISNEPIKISSSVSQYSCIKIGFSFLRSDNSVKNSEFLQFSFLKALKPDGFVPTPPDPVPLYELTKKAFVDSDITDDIINFYNLQGEKVVSYKVETGKINSISVNGTNIPTDDNKNVNLEVLEKKGGTVTGDIAILGDLSVNGTTYTKDTETLRVIDNIVVTNANKIKLIDLSGLVANVDENSSYAIVYNPTTDSVELGMGKIDANGKFQFTEKASPVAVRDDSSLFVDGHLIEVKKTNDKVMFVDSGKTLEDFVDLINEQTISGRKVFTDETQFNKGLYSDGEITANDSAFKSINTEKDTVVQYSDDITKTIGENTYTITLPDKDGTLATESDIKIKSVSFGTTDNILSPDDNGNVNLPPAEGNTNFTLKKAGVITRCVAEQIYVDPKVPGQLRFRTTGNDWIDRRLSGFGVITPGQLNYAVTAALTDEKHITLNDTQKTTAKEVFGVTEDYSDLSNKPKIGRTAETAVEVTGTMSIRDIGGIPLPATTESGDAPLAYAWTPTGGGQTRVLVCTPFSEGGTLIYRDANNNSTAHRSAGGAKIKTVADDSPYAHSEDITNRGYIQSKLASVTYYKHYVQLMIGTQTLCYDIISSQSTEYTAETLPMQPENVVTPFAFISNAYYSTVAGHIYKSGDDIKAIVYGMYTNDGSTMTYLQINGEICTFSSDTVVKLS